MTFFSKAVIGLAVATMAISTSSAENIAVKNSDDTVGLKSPVFAKLLILPGDEAASEKNDNNIGDGNSLARNISLSPEVFEGSSTHLDQIRRTPVVDDSSLGKSSLGVISAKKPRKVRRSRPVVKKYRVKRKTLKVASATARRANLKRRAPIVSGVYR